jgi:hypothetical protein
VHSGDLCLKKSDGSEACITGDQLAGMAAAGTPANGGGPGGPAAPSASGDASAGSRTTPASLKVNGNNPIQWEANKPWQDNLGALFTHAGHSETIYSTTTVDTSSAGTTTLDYWAQIPGADFLHATREVVVEGPANDNVVTSSPPAANDNPPPLAPTGTDASSTAQ